MLMKSLKERQRKAIKRRSRLHTKEERKCWCGKKFTCTLLNGYQAVQVACCVEHTKILEDKQEKKRQEEYDQAMSYSSSDGYGGWGMDD